MDDLTIEIADKDFTKVARRAAANYMLLQSLLGLSWWLLLFIAPSTRTWFFPTDLADTLTFTFAIPDLVLYVAGSFVCAMMLWLGSHCAVGVTWMIAGVSS